MKPYKYPDGCLPQTNKDRELCESLETAAVSYSTIYTLGEMPVLRWDTDFENFLNRRGNILNDMLLDGKPLFPWNVFAAEGRLSPAAPLYFSQGNTPSCMGHADDFAYRSSLLMSIGLGAPLRFAETDPYQTWLLSKGGSSRGGQSVTKMADFSNKKGHVLRGTKTCSKDHQSAMVFLSGGGAELAEKICRCVRAGLGVALGNSTAVSGCRMDDNGVPIAEFAGTWAHATSFNAWYKHGDTEYVFWTNSHGKRYKKGLLGEPADGTWMRTDKELLRFLSTAERYGKPYAVFAEGVQQPAATAREQ